jgi:hypothetical protein
MNLFKRTLLITGIVITILSLFACTTKSGEDAGSVIADFDLPAGYSADFSSSMLGYTVAAFKGPNEPSHLYLIQSEKESDGEELAKMLAQLVPGSSDPDSRMTVIEKRPVTLRGHETTLIISEGVNSESVPYRQITVAFEGKGGPALLMFSETVNAWDEATVDEFLSSIR